VYNRAVEGGLFKLFMEAGRILQKFASSLPTRAVDDSLVSRLLWSFGPLVVVILVILANS